MRVLLMLMRILYYLSVLLWLCLGIHMRREVTWIARIGTTRCRTDQLKEGQIGPVRCRTDQLKEKIITFTFEML